MMKKCFAMSLLMLLGVLCTWNSVQAASSSPFHSRESLLSSPADAPISVMTNKPIGEEVVADEVVANEAVADDAVKKNEEDKITTAGEKATVNGENEMVEEMPATGAEGCYEPENVISEPYATPCCEPRVTYGFHHRKHFRHHHRRHAHYGTACCEPACDPCCEPACEPACDPCCEPACDPCCEPACNPCCGPRRWCGWKHRRMLRRARYCCSPRISSYSTYDACGDVMNGVDALPSADCGCER